jgi:prepilin-type N-terminal cleavage/methylation domain-containing protein
MRRIHLKAFTLIEMLIVMAIIGVLAAMLVPAIQLGKNKARTVRARKEVNDLQSALQRYRAEYLFWPNTSDFPGDEKVDESKATLIGPTFSQMLAGEEVYKQNKKKMQFFNFTTKDASGTPITSFNVDSNQTRLLYYYARFDTDLNGRVNKGTGSAATEPGHYPTNDIGGEVVVWTFNPTEDADSELFVIGSWK